MFEFVSMWLFVGVDGLVNDESLVMVEVVQAGVRCNINYELVGNERMIKQFEMSVE